jgi:mono/diheme cytochrome c family protein
MRRWGRQAGVGAIALSMWVGAGVIGTSAQAPAAQAQAPAAAAAPQGNVANGKDLFVRVGCYQCHGREAHGAPGTGPRLGPAALPWARFSAYVRSPTGNMPPYRAVVLPDQSLADLYAWIRSVPRPPSVDSLPLLAPSQFK